MRKKNFLFVALFLLCSVTSYAQSQWGVFGQANLSGSTADGVGTRVGGSIGVMYDRKLTGVFQSVVAHASSVSLLQI